jgi:YD repeat-containing protein
VKYVERVRPPYCPEYLISCNEGVTLQYDVYDRLISHGASYFNQVTSYFNYSEDGSLTDVEEINNDSGRHTHVYHCEYTDTGQLARTVSFDEYGAREFSHYYEYDDQGRITTSKNQYWSSTDTTRFEYDDQGNLILEQHYDSDFIPENHDHSATHYAYDEWGNLASEAVTGVSEQTWAYDKNGNAIEHVKKREFSYSPGVIEKYEAVSWSYNDHGDMIKRTRIEYKTGRVSEWIWKYDDDGNVVTELWKPRALGATRGYSDAIHSWTYDALGNPTRQESVEYQLGVSTPRTTVKMLWHEPTGWGHIFSSPHGWSESLGFTAWSESLVPNPISTPMMIGQTAHRSCQPPLPNPRPSPRPPMTF